MFSFRHLFRLRKHKPIKRTSNHKGKRPRLEVEALESRLVPAITTAFDNGMLTISLSAAGDHVFVQGGDANGGIDVGTGDTGAPGIVVILPIVTFGSAQIVNPLATASPTTYPDNDILADQLGVTAIVVQNTSPGAGALNEEVSFYGTTAFAQNITTTNIQIVDVNSAMTGTINGNATTVNVNASTVYVTTPTATGGPGTIQDGVEFAAPGATVNVSAGTYTDLTIVDRTVTLRGYNAGADARTLASPQLPQTDVYSAAGSFDLEANDIVLDGFTIGNITSSNSIDAVGVLTSASFSGYQIRNNIFTSYDVGLSLGSSGTSQSIVEQNWIQIPGDAIGVNANETLSNLLLENNLLSTVNLTGATAPLTNVTIANNTFGSGTNVQLANVANSTITNNEFVGSLDGVSPIIRDPNEVPPLPTVPGIILGGGDTNITVSDNEFSGDRYRGHGGLAIQVADLGLGFGANSSISITDNRIFENLDLLVAGSTPVVAVIDLSGVEGTNTVNANLVSLSGVRQPPVRFVHALQIEGATTATVNVTNNELDGNDASFSNGIIGVYLSSTLPASAVISIRNNYISGFVYGIDADALPSGTQVHVNFNDLTGNSNLGVLNTPQPLVTPDVIAIGEPPPPAVQPPPDIIDLQDNWWGVTTAAAIGALISGNPPPTAWLTSGLDTEPNVTGFQPDLSSISSNNSATQPPTLTQIGTQNINRNQGPITIPLSATGTSGATITISAYLAAQAAVGLQQELQLSVDAAGLYANFYGHGDKWLRGVTNQFGNTWYFILPDGRLYAYDGTNQASGALVATLSAAYAANLSLLVQAQAPPSVVVSVAGDQLTVDPGTFAGSFDVVVQATDGVATTSESFTVNVASRPPVITQTPDQTFRSGQNQLTIPINVTNPDNVPLTYSAAAGNLGYVLGQQHHLRFAGSYYLNWGGAQEKWLEGDQNGNGNPWYFITPVGQVFAWDGKASATGTSVAYLDLIFYAHPELIASAQPQDLAGALNQALGLKTNGNLYQNYGGIGEKWLAGITNQFGNSWYFIDPSGQLFAWSGTPNQASGAFLATLDVIDYNQPQRLYAPTANPFTVAIDGNMLTINRAPGYLGSFDVLVLVSDGTTTAAERFHVTAG